MIDVHTRMDRRAHRVDVAALGRRNQRGAAIPVRAAQPPFERAAVGGRDGLASVVNANEPTIAIHLNLIRCRPCMCARAAAPGPAKPRLPAASGHVKSRRTHLEMKCSNS
ncbi:hypothetical protein [Burkholderia sp. Bp9142]|uniref:hypothetical protein n=1 Tax=Burkholderia sp. Bp9142 TaxID=2184573 RepID=UPI0016283C38|nr:hypothetical protein [Burkholderia sp. Bp9142]